MFAVVWFLLDVLRVRQDAENVAARDDRQLRKGGGRGRPGREKEVMRQTPRRRVQAQGTFPDPAHALRPPALSQRAKHEAAASHRCPRLGRDRVYSVHSVLSHHVEHLMSVFTTLFISDARKTQRRAHEPEGPAQSREAPTATRCEAGRSSTEPVRACPWAQGEGWAQAALPVPL